MAGHLGPGFEAKLPSLTEFLAVSDSSQAAHLLHGSWDTYDMNMTADINPKLEPLIRAARLGFSVRHHNVVISCGAGEQTGTVSIRDSTGAIDLQMFASDADSAIICLLFVTDWVSPESIAAFNKALRTSINIMRHGQSGPLFAAHYGGDMAEIPSTGLHFRITLPKFQLSAFQLHSKAHHPSMHKTMLSSQKTTAVAPNHKNHGVFKSLAAAVPGLQERVPQCPGCPRLPNEMIANVVIHLNDSHNWDRNRIADWLDTLDTDLRLKTP